VARVLDVFRIYYDDCEVEGDDPFTLRPHGVICVAVPGHLWHSKDAYYWHKDMGFVPCDQAGMWDYWLNYIGAKQVLFGRNVRDELYWEIIKKAKAL
jgi:hypothetical protein